MADRPILFSSPMVRALLAGTKTQTRRTFKAVEETRPGYFHVFGSGGGIFCDGEAEVKQWAPSYLRIAVGDRLYVREHWRVAPLHDDVRAGEVQWHVPIHYVADGGKTNSLPVLNAMGGRFRQGMHMPRWASRLTLTVTDVRVERLQDCSEADALAEGIAPWQGRYPFGLQLGPDDYCLGNTAVQAYRGLWNSINGPGSWDANPWVAAYSFIIEHGNIDQLAREA